MEKIIVLGGGGHAKVVIAILKKTRKYKVIGYTDITDKGDILGVPYLGGEQALPELQRRQKFNHAVLGIGQLEDAVLRQKLVRQLKKLGFLLPPVIAPSAVINEAVALGEGTVVMDGVVINSGTVLGKYNIINTGVCIDHDCTLGDFVHVAPGAVLCGGVEVGGNTLIGSGVNIIHYRRIGRACVIGAGSLVIKDCLKPGTYIGRPARLVHTK